MRLSRIAAMTVAAALVVSACGAGPFSIADEFDLPTIDMSESDDPAVRASSEAWEATVATQDAEDELKDGIAGDDLEAVRRARQLRPEDPRYVIFEDLLTNQQSLDDVCVNDPESIGNCADNPSVDNYRAARIAETQELIRAQNPDESEAEIKRIWTEMRLDAMREVIEGNPDSPMQAGRIQSYCFGVTSFYPDNYSGVDSSLYLATVAADGGLDICE